uniref:J domain-containing protein n=1 Tax=Curvibacter symbiont subsp. Hydra magnipapillata TaxID=667019 RepID=C9Y944_CURXX|nr:hypothetical protein Csp_A06450 [Curvibacter putative symbiont of Hydra magnipapillata]
MQTLYEILEVNTNASGEVIRAAYRCLAQKHHPDKSLPTESGDREGKMSELNYAYSVLSDPEKRNRYDLQIGLEKTIGDRRKVDGAFWSKRPSSRDEKTSVRPFGFRPLA